uniref:Truncated envelope glycoprotein n=1 Tax=Human immunodeficiency virus type 1 TaxID=11676 RepID=A0A0H3YCU2_HV1|nr:truncated envelope glycoprotein [Human immunodeficiency virus 1]
MRVTKMLKNCQP